MKGIQLLLVAWIVLLQLSCADKAVTSKEPEQILHDCSDPPVVRTGEATYYTWANGGGNCMFDPTPNDLMVAAMNHVDYAGSGVCGSSVRITGPAGEVTVRIVDQCGDCPVGNIDLSPAAFSRIADISLGRVPITWRFVPTAVQGNIIYHFKDGSNQWWTAVQIRNHRYPIARVEYKSQQGTFKSVNRTDYNFFVEPGGMGPGPYTFRVTDIYGHVWWIAASFIARIRMYREADSFRCVISSDRIS